MDRKQIIDGLASLPTIEIGRVPEDGEAWEGDEREAHFIITRCNFPAVAEIEGQQFGIEQITLSVSGPVKARRDLINEFCELLGVPATSETNPEMPDAIDFVVWLAMKLKS